MPVLTLIAGPDGAGKSTHSKELLADFGIEAFDFNKEFYTLWSEFNFDPFFEQGVLARTQKLYTERRTVALQKKQNLAFETSYHTNEIHAVVEMCRSGRYHLELIFICLESSEIAIERVKDRVAKGGHSVDEITIKKRFEDGLDRLDASFHQFDLVSIYLSKQNDIEGIAMLEPSRNKATSISRIPASLISHLPKLAGYIEQNR